MKYLLSGLISFLFITACDNTDRFASLSEDDSVVESSKGPEYLEEIQALVTEDVKEVKISGKKRQKVDVVDTVGENNLKETIKRTVTHIDVTNEVVVTEEQSTDGANEKIVDDLEAEVVKTAEKATDDSKTEVVKVTEKTDITVETKVKTAVEVKTETAESSEVAVVKKEEGLGPKLNILVYMNSREYSNCVGHLREYHESFLDGLSNYNWNISFAYYTNTAKLMPLEFHNGSAYNTLKLSEGGLFKTKLDYTLSKGKYPDERAKRLFYTTLQPTFDHSEHLSANLTPNAAKQVSSPLSGLDQILSSKMRKGAKTIVLFFGDQFHYYSSAEWDEFYSKHSNVSLIAVSYRSGNVSNLFHVLESDHDFSFVAGCDNKSAPKKILDAIFSVSGPID